MSGLIVVDCSVAAKWILPEPGRVAAVDLFDQHLRGDITLIAPDLLVAEFASLLARRCRRKEISTQQAFDAFSLMERIAPRLFSFHELAPQALALAVNSQISFWDSVYVALAIQHACPFITADGRLFRGAHARHPSIQMLAI